MLRSEDRALRGPTSKKAELDREMEREELVCPSPGPWQIGVKSLQLGDGEGMGTINSRRWLKCSKQHGGWGGGEGMGCQRTGSPEGEEVASFGSRGRVHPGGTITRMYSSPDSTMSSEDSTSH